MDKIVLKSLHEPISMPQSIVATIGTFDGVHRGHAFLIDQLKLLAEKQGLASAVITFDVPPVSVVRPNMPFQKLCSLSEKIEQIGAQGVDYCIVLPFDSVLASYSAERFMKEVLASLLKVKHLLIGYDHRFGNGGSNSIDDYISFGKAHGIEIQQSDAFSPQGELFSSSRVRHLLLDAELEKANQMLGYCYSLTGKVVSGFRIGKSLGFPTANILLDDPHKLIPSDGVYAVFVRVGISIFEGMLYIGKRPTLENGQHRSIEVNIFGFNSEIYGSDITVELISFVRPDIKFDTMDALREQLMKDYEAVKPVLASAEAFSRID